MTYTREDKPQRFWSEKLIIEELADELMVYDPDRNRAFCLNQTAAFVWRHSDGTRTVTEIAALMARELGKPSSEEVVWFALDALAKDGLLAPAEARPTAPADVTRRILLQRFGLGAAALPLVTVLTVSPAKAHASSIPLTSSWSRHNSNGNHNGNNWGRDGWDFWKNWF